MTAGRLQRLLRQMKSYEDSSHESGVSAYKTVDNFIPVEFKSGEIYIYDYSSTGRTAVEKMKRLAVSGEGLSTYISREVRKNFPTEI